MPQNRNRNRNSAKPSQRGERQKAYEPASLLIVEVGNKSETNDATLKESLLLKQYAEMNRYIRATCQLTMAWYTFFITGNLIASGWLFSEAVEGGRMPPLYVIIVSGLFIFINVLSTIGFTELIPYLRETNLQLVIILNSLTCPPIEVAVLEKSERPLILRFKAAILRIFKRPVIKVDDNLKVFSPCPHELYIRLLKYYRLSLLAVTAFWILLLILKLNPSIVAKAH